MAQWMQDLFAGWPMIRANPPTFFIILVLMIGGVWFAMNLIYGGILSNKDGVISNKDSEIALLKGQRDDYKEKLGGATPDQAKARIDALEARLTRIEPRHLTDAQITDLIDRLRNGSSSIRIDADTRGGKSEFIPIADFYAGDIAPDDIRRELEGTFKANDIPVLIIDEYDKIGDKKKTNELMANTIKALSDYGVNVTLVLVGVADNINDLLGEHASIGRCVEQIPMPRMNITERREILEKIVPRLGMKLHDDALWKIVHLSRGLPAYVHSLGLYSTESAINRRSLLITESDVDAAMKRVLERSQESIKEEYSKAIHSNRSDNLYKEVLLACALADTDSEGRGTFTPLAVCKPLVNILDRPVKIDAFQQHLKKFITEERADILVRRGHERAYRFRFREPMMQPFVIMQGIEQGLVDPSAIDALSFPAQGKLPI